MQIACYSCQISIQLEFLERFPKNTRISIFLKILQMGDEFFHVDGETDGHDEVYIYIYIITSYTTIVKLTNLSATHYRIPYCALDLYKLA